MPEKKTAHGILKIFEWDKLSSLLTPIIGVLVGLIITAFVIASQGVDPITAYKELFIGALGGLSEITFTLLEFIPLALAGLAVTIAYRGGMFNIGAEGQIYVAALATTWFAVSFPDIPAFLMIPLCLLIGACVAGLFAFVPGYLKAKHGMNEVLITMLMNYVGINLVGLAVNSFLKAPGQPQPKSPLLPKSAWLPNLIPGTYLHIGIILVLILAGVLYYVLFHTSWGYEIRSVGNNRRGAAYSGIPVEKTMIMTMVFSGMLAGLAGSIVIMGTQHRLLANFLVNYGYDAIPVALLGGLNPLGVLGTAFLFGVLKNGGNAMQIAMGVPVSVVSIVNAIAILSIIAITQVKKLYFKSKGGAKQWK